MPGYLRGGTWALLGLLLGTSAAAYGQAASKAQLPGFPNTPEGSVQAFTFAIATGNEAALRAVTLPLSAEDFAWLMKGQHVPTDKVEEFRKFVEEGMKVRIGRPGEKFPLPGGRVVEIKPEDFAADRSVVVQEGAPLPNRVRKLEGRWRIDAGPVVAGRKAADAARRRAEDKAKGNAKTKP
jgi:hypothetical protein